MRAVAQTKTQFENQRDNDMSRGTITEAKGQLWNYTNNRITYVQWQKQMLQMHKETET